ncbi:ABC transporter ATP-binding protein [Agaricicola taiwanensis]|uniref:ABC transporter ATP-binding protein n=1 Tax=Agaricicola taiwanensis TaxID=591372 RepID=A0A8J3DVQ2_9RHOB|nr:ABC transporter ATP-binding protein [Agaricicola taiwanensis]GGE45351.1 ABC transporter ATP-binding protein [Agaricicola taiwanensis]
MSETIDPLPKPRWGRRIAAGVSIPSRLSFTGLTHRYGRVTAVDDLTLSVEPGEIVALLGRSGCGKTTLLRVAAGIERQVSGDVHLDDRLIAGEGVFTPPERRGIGLVFQDYALFPHLDIVQNVAFGLKSLSSAEARRAALAALERVGMARHAGSYPHALSGGEQQRVALARAVAPRPGVLLMDEPFSGLDKRLRDSVREETLAVLRETGATCLIVTHDPEEAMRMADRIALMRSGKLVQAGTAEELYLRPSDLFVGRFFSELNEIDAVARNGRVETPLGTFPTGIGDGPVTAAIRLSALRVVPSGEGVIGTLLSRRFLGEVELLEIGIESLDLPIRARVPAGVPFAPRDEVRIITDPSGVLVFPADGT